MVRRHNELDETDLQYVTNQHPNPAHHVNPV